MEKYTLITGATSGLGKELSYIYASNKNNLFLVSRNEKELSSLQGEIINKYSTFVTLSSFYDYCSFKLKKEKMIKKTLIIISANSVFYWKVFIFFATFWTN